MIKQSLVLNNLMNLSKNKNLVFRCYFSNSFLIFEFKKNAFVIFEI